MNMFRKLRVNHFVDLIRRTQLGQDRVTANLAATAVLAKMTNPSSNQGAIINKHIIIVTNSGDEAPKKIIIQRDDNHHEYAAVPISAVSDSVISEIKNHLNPDRIMTSAQWDEDISYTRKKQVYALVNGLPQLVMLLMQQLETSRREVKLNDVRKVLTNLTQHIKQEFIRSGAVWELTQAGLYLHDQK